MATTVLITGASSGIGLELATLVAAEGMHLILVARQASILNQLADRLRAEYAVTVQVVAQDLCAADAVSSLLNAIDASKVDILVNNAGCGDFGLFQHVSWKSYKQTMTLNMLALTELSHALLPVMLQRGSGQIVNIASTAAFQPLAYMALYAATKSYVLSLSEAMAFELRHSNVRVLAICPGATRTGFANAANGSHSNNFSEQNTASAADVAAFSLKKIKAGNSGVFVHGAMNRSMSWLVPLSPRALVLRMAERVMRPL